VNDTRRIRAADDAAISEAGRLIVDGRLVAFPTETVYGLGADARHFNFNTYSDSRSLFRYDMHTLPGEIDFQGSSVGTSTLFAAWSNATYVAQIEDERLADVMQTGFYMDAARDVVGMETPDALAQDASGGCMCPPGMPAGAVVA
jgi:hypothetical protein